MIIDFQGASAIIASCARSDSVMAFGGIAVLLIGAAMMLETQARLFVPVAGIAAMAQANHERLKQRVEALDRLY